MGLSRGKIYFLGTLAVIIAAACITIPLVLNQQSHSSNPNNATRALATTIAEALATASSPTSSQAAVTTETHDVLKTSAAAEDSAGAADKEDSELDQPDTATHGVSPVNAEVSRQFEPTTHTMPEATQATHVTHEVPQPANPSPTHELPGTTREEPLHASSPMNQPTPTAPEHSSPVQPEHPNPTLPEQPLETQPTAMEPQNPEVRQPEHDNMNGPVSPQVPPAAESPAPMTQGFPAGEHLPMTTGPV